MNYEDYLKKESFMLCKKCNHALQISRGTVQHYTSLNGVCDSSTGCDCTKPILKEKVVYYSNALEAVRLARKEEREKCKLELQSESARMTDEAVDTLQEAKKCRFCDNNGLSMCLDCQINLKRTVEEETSKKVEARVRKEEQEKAKEEGKLLVKSIYTDPDKMVEHWRSLAVKFGSDAEKGSFETAKEIL